MAGGRTGCALLVLLSVPLIRCFLQGSGHGGYYSLPPPTATECGKASLASPLPPPSGTGKFSPVAFTWAMLQSWPGAADQI